MQIAEATWQLGLASVGDRSEPRGVSEASAVLHGLVRDAANHLHSSVTGRARAADTVDELIDVFTDCSETDWDGYGAARIGCESFLEAISFLDQAPSTVAMPSIVPEPNGEIGLEWSFRGAKTLVVSFSGTTHLTFAGLLGGGNKIYGTTRYVGPIPEVISQILVQHFPAR